MRIKLLIASLLTISFNSYAGSWEIYPTNDELKVIKGQPDVIINGVKQRNLCKAVSMVFGNYDPYSAETIYRTAQRNPAVTEVIKTNRDTSYKIGYLCKVENGAIITSHISMANAPNQEEKIGRWRQHSDDQKITFSIDHNNLFINISGLDGSKEIKKTSFPMKLVSSWK